MKQVTMHITLKDSCGTVCTPNGFALKARCERLKRELKANQSSSLYSVGGFNHA